MEQDNKIDVAEFACINSYYFFKSDNAYGHRLLSTREIGSWTA